MSTNPPLKFGQALNQAQQDKTQQGTTASEAKLEPKGDLNPSDTGPASGGDTGGQLDPGTDIRTNLQTTNEQVVSSREVDGRVNSERQVADASRLAAAPIDHAVQAGNQINAVEALPRDSDELTESYALTQGAQNLDMGEPFVFKNGALHLNKEDSERFDQNLKSQPKYIQNQIVKIDREVGEAYIRKLMEQQAKAPTQVTGVDTTSGTPGPDGKINL